MNMTRDTMDAQNLTRVTLSKFLNRRWQQQHSHPLLLQTPISVSPHKIEEMGNRARLRVRKTTLIKCGSSSSSSSGRKLLLNKFAHYLTSQTFMYAPLLSPLPDNFPSPSKVVEVELKKPLREKQLFVEHVMEYLKSDDYMYAPLLDLSHSPQEPLQHSGMIGMDVSPRGLTMKVNQQINHLGNVNQRSENHLPQTDLSGQQTRDPKESVKHTVSQICHSTSASRNMTLNSPLRAHG